LIQPLRFADEKSAQSGVGQLLINHMRFSCVRRSAQKETFQNWRRKDTSQQSENTRCLSLYQGHHQPFYKVVIFSLLSLASKEMPGFLWLIDSSKTHLFPFRE
jgi:hypothetical protein